MTVSEIHNASKKQPVWYRVKSIHWKRVLLFETILFFILLILVPAFILKTAEDQSWLIEKHANPYAAAFSIPTEEDWDVILAQSQMEKLPLSDRKAFATHFLENLSSLAEEEGYSRAELKSWLLETVSNLEKYPIKTFKIGENNQTSYRDLTNSNFPQTSKARLFKKYLFDGGNILISLTILPFFSFFLFIFILIFNSFLSKELLFKYKFLTLVLVLISIGEGYLLYVNLKSNKAAPVSVIGYFYYDGKKNSPSSDNYVSVQGTWISDTKLAFPINKAEVKCLRDKGICISCEADVFEGVLTTDLTFNDVSKWSANEITYETDAPCAKTTTTIDRDQQKITEVSVSKTTLDFCRKLERPPIASYMADGFQEYMKLRN